MLTKTSANIFSPELKQVQVKKSSQLPPVHELIPKGRRFLELVHERVSSK